MVRMKLNPIEADVKDKRVFVVEDSIVRGTNAPIVIAMLREAGAIEVHFRSATPPHKNACHYGLATGNAEELIGYRHDNDEGIRQEIGADSFKHLDVDEMLEALGSGEVKKFCTACFDGDYPTPIDPT
jgi:amidophosphoribosyltransferase